MRIIYLKSESDHSSFDQTVREVAVEREDEDNWYGKPRTNPGLPNFAMAKVCLERNRTKKGARKARTRSPDPGTNSHPQRRRNRC